MKNKKLKLLLWAGLPFLLIAFIAVMIIKHTVRKRIESKLNENSSEYIVSIEKIQISMLTRGINLREIKITSGKDSGDVFELDGEISSIKFKGISIAKAIFKREIAIRKITFSDSYLKGKSTSSGKSKLPVILPLNINIDKIIFNKINLSVIADSSAASYSIKDGNLVFYKIKAEKHDTLNTGILKSFDFRAEELALVSADSMYSYFFSQILYSATSKILEIDSMAIQPNSDEYKFTAHYKFQKSRVEAGFSNISVHGFNPSRYMRSGTIAASGVEILKMDMKVFKDKRIEFNHLKKEAFQDILYNYPDTIGIDSLELSEANITYTEHAEGANENGTLDFTGTNARIYNITNNAIYKTETEYLKLEAEAMLMGKGKVTIQLKAKLFDDSNTFSVFGKLAAMEVQEINPFLEKTAFIYATAGNIEKMDFSFIADNKQAKGKMIMLYTGLDLALKNKKSDDTTAIKERIISILINRKVINSNPLPDKVIREGIIYYERDPEKFLFSYFAKSVMSGIRSSLLK